jgi:hypothetical protein
MFNVSYGDVFRDNGTYHIKRLCVVPGKLDVGDRKHAN